MSHGVTTPGTRMHPRQLLLGLAIAIVAASPAKLAAQRNHRDYYPRIDYGAMHERIRTSMDRALERSQRTIERSTRQSMRAAERASRTAERAALRARDRADDRRYFDRDAFERRMDRLRVRLDNRVRVRVRDYRWRW